MSKVIAICNQKGGVGKTTTVANLSVALALEGKRVLAIDLDPQAALSCCFGLPDTDNLETTVATMMAKSINEEHFKYDEGLIKVEAGVSLLPANLDLSGLEVSLIGTMNRERVLKGYLDKIKRYFDYVLIDCMPSLGMITMNALSAADSVIIPVQAHYLPARGMEKLFKCIKKVRKYVNPKLEIDGVLMTFIDARTNLSKEVPEIIRDTYGADLRIYKEQIPHRIKLAEISAEGVSILKKEPNGNVAKAYKDMAKEVIEDAKREKAKLRVERSR